MVCTKSQFLLILESGSLINIWDMVPQIYWIIIFSLQFPARAAGSHVASVQQCNDHEELVPSVSDRLQPATSHGDVWRPD